MSAYTDAAQSVVDDANRLKDLMDGSKTEYTPRNLPAQENVPALMQRIVDEANDVLNSLGQAGGLMAPIYSSKTTFNADVSGLDDGYYLVTPDSSQANAPVIYAVLAGVATLLTNMESWRISDASLTRNATDAARIAALASGSIVRMGGLMYRVDASATGTLSATNDLGVNGLVPDGDVYAEHFGAVADGVYATLAGTNNGPLLQRAVDWIYTRRGSGTLHLRDGVYGVSSEVQIKPNTSVRGAGRGATTLFAKVDAIRIFGTHSLGKAGTIGLYDLTCFGYAATNSAESLLVTDRAVRLGPANVIVVDNVEAAWARNMCLSGTGDDVTVTNCYVHNSMRDGINFTGCLRGTIANNVGEYIGDDFIAMHLDSSVTATTRSYEPSVISGNRGYMTYGIVALGARNLVMHDNVGRFCQGRWLGVGVGTGTAPEGAIEALSINIHDNSALDILHRKTFGVDTTYSRMIWLGFQNEVAGSGAYSTAVAPGRFSAGVAVLPGVQWDYPDPDLVGRARGPSRGVQVHNNIGMQLLGDEVLDHFADAGFGQMWDKGFADPQFTGTMWEVAREYTTGSPLPVDSAGIHITGSFDGLSISGNQFYGFEKGIYYSDVNPAYSTFGLSIIGNQFSRFQYGIYFANATGGSRQVEASISHNTFNADPFHRHADRAVDGSWANLSDFTMVCYRGFGNYGLSFVNNTIRNVRTIFYQTIKMVYRDNILFADPVTGGGIGQIQMPLKNDLMWIDADPRNSTYGTVLNANQQLGDYDAQPTAGSWLKGVFLPKATPSVNANNMILSGWLRMTTGSANVANTDWRPIYQSVVTPAA